MANTHLPVQKLNCKVCILIFKVKFGSEEQMEAVSIGQALTPALQAASLCPLAQHFYLLLSPHCGDTAVAHKWQYILATYIPLMIWKLIFSQMDS